MGCVIDELTDRIYQAKTKYLKCTCGEGPAPHADTCPLALAYGAARNEANDQLYGDIDIPPCHNTGRPKSREGEQAPAPSPPADEKGLSKAIAGCEDLATLKYLAHQYCRDRWQANAEVAAKQKLLDDVAASRREITLQLGDAVIELERLKERYSYIREHRERLVAVAEQGKRYLEQIKMNTGLQRHFARAIDNTGAGPEEKPENTQTDSPLAGGGGH